MGRRRRPGLENMYTYTKRLAIAAGLSLGLLISDEGSTRAEEQEVEVLGLWQNEKGDGLIRVSLKADGTLVGVGAEGVGDPERRDTKNPDPKLRTRRLAGAQILWGFRPENDRKTKWKDGKIYDPSNGKTYDCKIELKKGELHIRGYVGIPLFGRTTVWKRRG